MSVSKQWIVEEQTELLQFLYKMMPKRSRNSVKGILARGQVLVNNQKETQFNLILNKNDTIEILSHVISEDARLRGIEILFEDKDFIIVHKASGLLSIGTNKGNEQTVHQQLNEYIKRVNPRKQIFIVHRLDRDTSGVMMLAKNREIQQEMQNNWQKFVQERSYVALVEGKVERDGTVTSWLTENEQHMVLSSPTDNGGKKAITHYEVLETGQTYSLLKVYLDTGRKNQIRVHMKDIGHPIVGDKKYGSKKNPIRRLGLHAETLRFTHPKTKKTITYTRRAPRFFRSTVQ